MSHGSKAKNALVLVLASMRADQQFNRIAAQFNCLGVKDAV